jgi:hypothetical protein
MAIWYGYRARKTQRNVIVWALAGAVATFLASTVLTNLTLFLATGTITGRVDFNTFLTVRLVGAILGIIASVLLGLAVLPVGTIPTASAAICVRCGSELQDGGLSKRVDGVLQFPLCGKCFGAV